MGPLSFFNFGNKSPRDAAARQRPAMTGKVRCIRFECLEPRRLLSTSYPYLTPAQVRHAYGIDQINFGSTPGDGSGQTIAIIDPGNDSHITSDLNSFDAAFATNAPASFTRPAADFFSVIGETGGTVPLYPTITGATVSTSQVVTVTTATAHGLSAGDYVNITGFADTALNGYYQVSGATSNTATNTFTFTYTDTSLPSGVSGSSTGGVLANPVDSSETAMDVEWAHAIAPGANIVLIEMSGGIRGDDIANALNTAGPVNAGTNPDGVGASVVSMSFSFNEFNGETGGSTTSFDDGLFTAPNVTYVASTADAGIPGGYPAFSPNVLAVGATNLNVTANGSYVSETGWSNPAAITSAAESPSGTGYLVKITTANATGLSPGNPINVAGVGPGYNGSQTVLAAPSANSFTYMVNTAGTAAIAAPVNIASIAYDAATSTVTVTTTAPHGLSDNASVLISGVDGSDASNFNGVFQIGGVSASSPDTFTYTDSRSGLGNLSSPGGTVASAIAYNGGGGHNAGGSGGGIGQGETTQPAYQQGTVTKVTQSTTNRTIPDVSFVGGGATPVEIYNSQLASNWGTSLSAPCWAGLVAIADQGIAAEGKPATSLFSSMATSATSLQTALYNAPLSDFHDITSGYNGASAGAGYDLVTGIGSPVANVLIPDLAGSSIDYAVPLTGSPHQLVLAKVGANVELLDNGSVVETAPLGTISDMVITDPNTSNDSLTLDYPYQGIFALQADFDHTASSGYDTLIVDDPNGQSNTVSVTQGPGAAGSIVVDGTAGGTEPQAINFQGVAEVDVNAGSDGDAVTLNGDGATSGLQTVHVLGGAGNDSLTVNSSNGLFDLANGIQFDGGGGLNSLVLAQSGANGPTITSDQLAPGSGPGSGESILEDSQGNQQVVAFQNLQPITDSVPASTFTLGSVAGLASLLDTGNAITYTASATPGYGRITVDDFDPIEFTNKDHLAIDAGAGSDVIDLHNPATPHGDTAAGLIDITVAGGDPNGPAAASDTLVVNGIAGTKEKLQYNPTGLGDGNIVNAAQPKVIFSGMENLQIVGQDADGDTLAYNAPASGTSQPGDQITYTPGGTSDAGEIDAVENGSGGAALVPLSFTGFATGGIAFTSATGLQQDTLIVDGTSGSDTFTVNGPSDSVLLNASGLAGGAGLLEAPLLTTTGINLLVLRSQGGDDTVALTGPLPYIAGIIVDGGGNSIVNLSGAVSPGPVQVQLADSASPTQGDATSIDGYHSGSGTGPVELMGVAVANLNANGQAMTVEGTSESDNITYTPSGAHAGAFALAGLNTVFNFTGTVAGFTINGGSAGVGNDGATNQVLVQGTNARDLVRIDQGNRTVQVLAYDTEALQPVTLGNDIQTLTVQGLQGEDTFQVLPAKGIPAFTGDSAELDNLLINIEGGSSVTTDALVLGSNFATLGDSMPALPSNDFVVVDRSLTPSAGTLRVFSAGGHGITQFPDINYQNITTVSAQVGGTSVNPNLLVLGPDGYEPNNTQATAAFLGSGATLQIQNASIFPSDEENPGTPDDRDYYRVVAQTTGTLDFQVYFKLYPGLLPAGGALNIAVYDAAGNLVGEASDGAAHFGALGTAANARVRIPAVAGQSYYLEVFGWNPPGGAVNAYNATIIDTPAPVPYDLELSRSVPAASAGSPDTGDLPPNAPSDDSGRSQFDNVTNVSQPTIYIRLAGGSLLNDLPGNDITNTPPAGVIPIPYSSTATTPGFRVAIFDGANTQTPVGFAAPVGSAFPGLYQYTFATALSNGLHDLVAEVQMIDPATPTEKGFGGQSAALQITIDTVPPPVSFGTAGLADTGLVAASDSGVQSYPATFADRVTNDAYPTFYGTAEADSIVRLYADLDGNPATTGDQILLGTTTTLPADGANADLAGQWTITSTVNLNNPAIFPHDGIRHIFVTAEDLAGNVNTWTAASPAAQELDIFLDTQGPRITNVGITNSPLYNLFAEKTAGGVASPTPLVDGLDISVEGLAPRAAPGFLFDAVYQPVALNPGNYVLTGDANGIIPILSVTYIPGVVANGQAATGTIRLTFKTPLPDDRYTLTVSDNIVDAAGNKLDGESNAAEPNGQPSFPSGDGQPGGNFVARFTVDSRPEIGAWSGGSAWIDTNGNFVWDPNNVDASNRDATYAIGSASDQDFAGNFSVPTSPNGSAATASANGFSKLSAYGLVGSNYRWLIENDAGVPMITYNNPGNINGSPVAGDWNPTGTAPAGHDEVGLFTNATWYLYTGGQYGDGLGGAVTQVPVWHAGYPIVGDFDGDGHIDLATYSNGVFYFQLWDAKTKTWDIDQQINVNGEGLPLGANTRPVAADMDHDGITDIGLYTPAGAGGTSNSLSDWYFWLSNDPATNTAGQALPQKRITGQVNTLNHPFSSVSLGGSDLYAQMGDSDAMPIVGNFDPPMGGAATSAPTPTPSSLTVTLVGTAGNDTFSFAPGSAANTWSITLNGVAKIYTAASINVSFNGQGGIDTAIIHGAGANQTAVLRPGSGTFSGRGYQVYVVAEAITADVDGGRGQATFYGQALSTNYFSGSPTMAQMSDSASAAWKDYFNSETGFQSVAAYGTPGGRDLALANDGGVKSVFSAAGHAATLTTLDPKTADYALALYDFGTVTATLKNKATVRNRAAIDYLLMFSNP